MRTSPSTPQLSPAENRSELLILADGTVLAHNLTPALAEVLQALAPQDETLKLRSASAPVPERGHSCPQQ
ncbi:MAG TPA: hypothetical protein VNZ22_12845, partial [Bacillota bacterium]|nr:hypothetical protein [Bacillota bacterium]